MKVVRANVHSTEPGSPDNFTGSVWNESLALGESSSQLHVGRVTFAPGARTHWHSHPQGQILLAISGIGHVQSDGEPLRELYPGDSVSVAPEERHWHGAARDQVFVHLAMQEPGPEGTQAEWFQPVTVDEYL